MNKFYLFFILLGIYYFIIPLIFLFNNFLSSNQIFIHEVNYINIILNIPNHYIKYNFFSLILLFFIFYILYRNFYFIKNIKKIKIHNLTYIFIIIICIIFLLKDIFYLLKYYYDNEIINRSSLYYELLNNRRSHLNLLIIISAVNFKDNKILSYLSYFLIFVYSILSLSRIELLILFLCHFITNVSFDKKKSLKFSLISIFIIFFISFYRFAITGQNFFFIFIEPLHLMISSIIFSKTLLLTLNDYISQNINFFLKDFFYLPTNLYNYFKYPYPEIPVYSIRGIDSIICYFIVFLVYYFILKLLINNFYINKYFLNCTFAYLLISLFRGNFVHNLNFIIKIYLLVIVLSWIIQKFRQLKLKVV